MLGHNELRLNEATMIEALEEYLSKRANPNVARKWKVSAVLVETSTRGAITADWFVVKTIGAGSDKEPVPA